MRNKRWIATAVAIIMLVIGWFAGVQLALADNREQLAQKYAALAGSPAAAGTLVNGIGEGTPFRIGATQFAPPTGKMSESSIDAVLTLAQAKLRQQGIAQPTPEQLRGVLIGDPQHPGVLALRAEGKGWAQVARGMELRPGDVIRHH